MQLRPYQTSIAQKVYETISKYNVCYISAEVRTGKSLMALESARLLLCKNVLFITKIKAFSSIQSDYDTFGYKDSFDITIINKESVHKVQGCFDLIIIDEAHGLGSFPKPGVHTKTIKKLFSKKRIIFLSGTPAPESYSQIYHQLWVSDYSPFKIYKNFYGWADIFVTKGVIYTSYGQAVDYSKAKYDLIMSKISHLMITFTQAQAGFTTTIDEEILTVKMKPYTYSLIDRLIKDLVIEGKSGTILGDTAVKLQSKVHQLYSGSIKTEEGNYVVIDDSKAQFILSHFSGKKIAIYYKFIAERMMLEQVLGTRLTDNLDEFNSTDKWFYSQFVSGREGISLKQADNLVFLNIDFSCVSYVQARDRMSTMDRTHNKIYWIFSEGGIEEKVLEIVRKKKNYSSKIFTKDYGIKNTN